ncbi:MAG: hypothetical protein ABJB16_15735 [Saprospiraceae bacterium]
MAEKAEKVEVAEKAEWGKCFDTFDYPQCDACWRSVRRLLAIIPVLNYGYSSGLNVFVAIDFYLSQA